MSRIKRTAFTLIELLVVITLILVLSSLSIMFVPRMSEQQRAARGGSLLQQWLITAQNQALRAQSPYGVRFYLDANNNMHGIEAQFIMQPDDLKGGNVATLTDDSNTAVLNGIDITNDSTDSSTWMIQDGDYLELFGIGLVHRIGPPAPGTGSTTLPLPFSKIPFKVDTNEYRIIRQPRPAGDEALKLPDDIVIDFSKKSNLDTAFTFNEFTDGAGQKIVESVDILFGPAGNVIGKQMGLDSIIFWVRDVTLNLNEGEPTLITIYSRTGAIEAHPVNFSGFDATLTPPFPDPYTFTRDGRSSGG